MPCGPQLQAQTARIDPCERLTAPPAPACPAAPSGPH